MVRRIVLGLPFGLLALFLAGCLDFDTRVRLASDGTFVGHMSFSGPDWLLAKWTGEPVEGLEDEQLLLRNSGVHTKQTGKGIWISGRQVSAADISFLTWRFEPSGDSWQFGGAFQIDPEELANIEREFMTRTMRTPRMHEGRASGLAKKAYENSKLHLRVLFPGTVRNTNGELKSGHVHWTLPLSELRENNGVFALTADGELASSPMQTVLAWVAGTEMD
jgi:hypothetical protein